MNEKYSINTGQNDVLRNLISVHRKFQEELDIITSSNNNPAIIESLIELRNFNINVTNRYCAMQIRSQYDLFSSTITPKMKSFGVSEEEVM